MNDRATLACHYSKGRPPIRPDMRTKSEPKEQIVYAERTAWLKSDYPLSSSRKPTQTWSRYRQIIFFLFLTRQTRK